MSQAWFPSLLLNVVLRSQGLFVKSPKEEERAGCDTAIDTGRVLGSQMCNMQVECVASF